MKISKFILGILMISSSIVWAQPRQQIVGNSVWKAPFHEDHSLLLTAVQTNLAEDCRQYEVFRSENTKLTQEDIDFARRLPLAGAMKSMYEADFHIEHETSGSSAVSQKESLPFWVTSPQIEVQISKLKDVVILQGTFDGLIRRSSEAGVMPMLPLLQEGSFASSRLLRISERDLACDLLAGRVLLSAKTHSYVSPSVQDITDINKWTKSVTDKVAEAEKQTSNLYERAAFMGLRFSEDYRQRSNNTSEVESYIAAVFETLFIADSLRPNDFLQPFADGWMLNYPKTQKTEDHSVILKVKSSAKEETGRQVASQQLQKVESELRSMDHLSYDDMNAEQLEKFNFLNRRRAEILKKRIWAAYGRYR